MLDRGSPKDSNPSGLIFTHVLNRGGRAAPGSETDLGEQTNVAAEHPELVAKMEAILNEAHVADERWPMPKPKRK